MDSKNILTSKRFWANIIGFIASMAPMFGFNLDMTPEQQASLTGTVLMVVNVILLVTSKKSVHVTE